MSHAGVAVRLIAANLDQRAAPVSVAEHLGISAGTRIPHLVRIRGDDHGPIALFTSWFTPGIDLRTGDDLASPLYELIGARGGPQPVSSEEELVAVRPSAEVARRLGGGTNMPVLERRRRVLTLDGTCFEYAVVHYRSDRFHLRLRLGPAGE
jgi:DNA-binding GntR family transcriptional regulator